MSAFWDCLTSIGVDADGIAAEVGLGGAEVLLLPVHNRLHRATLELISVDDCVLCYIVIGDSIITL